MVSLDNLDIVGQILKLSYRYSARLAVRNTCLMPQQAQKQGRVEVVSRSLHEESGADRPRL